MSDDPGGTPVLVTDPHHNNRDRKDWQGEIVGISGQFLVIRLTYDPHGNPCGHHRLFMAEIGELESPVDWERYRA